MAAPSRFLNGVSTEKVGHPLQNLPYPNPSYNPMYFNDFFTYAAADWTVTAGGGGSSTATAAGVGGQLLLTCATSGCQSNIGLGSFAFKVATASAKGNQVWFDCDVTVDATVANPDYQIGLAKGTASSLNNTTDGVYFTKATGAATWSLVVKAAAGSTSTFALPGTTTANSAEIGLSYWFDGKASLYVYYNEVLVGTICDETTGVKGTLGTAGANNLVNMPASTINLAPVMLNAFHTATSTLTVDYLLASCEMTRN